MGQASLDGRIFPKRAASRVANSTPGWPFGSITRVKRRWASARPPPYGIEIKQTPKWQKCAKTGLIRRNNVSAASRLSAALCVQMAFVNGRHAGFCIYREWPMR
jgi:hypothetical protein